MPGVSYQHIGHDPRLGAIALWSLDEQGVLHENRQKFDEPNAAWLDFSHDNCFREVKKTRALGRVELDRRTGSIHISDEAILRSEVKLCRILDALDKKYPSTRWYVFGPGCAGETVTALLAQKAAA